MSLKWRLLVDKIYLMMEDPVPRLGASRLLLIVLSPGSFLCDYWKMKYVIV
jgi:hypothetical protein